MEKSVKNQIEFSQISYHDGKENCVQIDCNSLEESTTQTFTKKFHETGSQMEVLDNAKLIQIVDKRKTENKASNRKGEITILNETNK